MTAERFWRDANESRGTLDDSEPVWNGCKRQKRDTKSLRSGCERAAKVYWGQLEGILEKRPNKPQKKNTKNWPILWAEATDLGPALGHMEPDAPQHITQILQSAQALGWSLCGKNRKRSQTEVKYVRQMFQKTINLQ